MARNLLAAGYEMTAFDVRDDALAGVAANGARAATGPAAVAAESTIVITSLPNSAIVEEVALGPGGLLERAEPGSLLVEMSTIDPSLVRRLAGAAAERGIAVLDAPVSGGDVGAEAGTLSIMVGGEAADLERARPVLEALGTTIVHVGPHGAGQIVKACNQILVGITFAGVSEALVLGSKAGVAPELILDVLTGGFAGNRIMEVRRRNFLEHDFTPGGPVDQLYKDLTISLDAARETGVPVPVTALVHQMYEVLRANGHGGLDNSALLTLVERWANHRVGG